MADALPGETYEGWGGKVGRTFAASESWWPPRTEAPEGAPNVVLVLVDDLGFSDLGCYGSEIPTPNIDSLAERGVRYGNFHVAPLCSPTRAALLTGRNSHSAGVGFVAHVNPGFPGYVSQLPDNQPTLAEVFRENGYSTLMVGKWHLTNDAESGEAGDHSSWPLQRGFDEFYGILDALTNFHHPHRLHDGNSVVHVDEYPEGYYVTDDFTDRAIRMMHGVKANNPRKPFFLYFAHTAVHAPLHAKPEDIERHRGNYDMGWDELREQRLARQKELGVVGPATRLPERNTEQGEDVEPWEDIPDELKPLYSRYMEVYAAMVDSVDQSVGRLIECLEDLGELDNTIFIVTSDNGASREGQATGSSNYGRGVLAEPGKRRFDADSLRKDLERIDVMGGPNTWPHYPRGWAMACNTPFRLYKITTFAGGHQVPLVVSWPDRLANDGAIVGKQYTHVTDILPTLVDLIGLQYPEDRHGKKPDPLAGSSFAQTLHDIDAETHHNEQYIECIGARALHQDGWDALTYRIAGTPFSEEHWYLFHTAEDPTQIDDLSEVHPERVEAMKQRFDELAWENHVFPIYEGHGIHMLIRPPWEEAFVDPLTIFPQTPSSERHRGTRFISGRSFRIFVDWAFEPGDQGVVVAHGGQDSGYVLYVEGGKLTFAINYASDMYLTDPIDLDGPSRSIVVDVSAPGGGIWNTTIEVDGQTRAQLDGVPAIAGYFPYEGIDVGVDRRSPVSWELYERHRSFPFTGTINKVRYEAGDFSPDAGPFMLERARALGLALE